MNKGALEYCKKLAGEKCYLIELLQDGRKPSVEEEECQHRASAGGPVATTDDLHFQAVRVLLKEDSSWTHVKISRELGIAASTVHTILRKKTPLFISTKHLFRPVLLTKCEKQ